MKIIFKSKISFYIFVILFLLIQGLLKTFISTDLLLNILLPFFFFVVTILYSYYSKEGNWKNTIEISMFYMIISYIIFHYQINSYRVIIFMASGFLGNLISSFTFNLKKEKLRTYREEEKKILSYLAPLIFILILETFYKLVTFGKLNFSFYLFPVLILLLIVYIFYFFISSFVKNSFYTNLIFLSIFLLLFVVNQMRIYYTSDTFLIYDVMYLEAANEMANFVDVTLLYALNYILWPLLIVSPLFIWLLEKLKRNKVYYYNKRIDFKRMAITIVLFSLLFFPSETIGKFILENAYSVKKRPDYSIYVSNTNYYYEYGVVSGMYGKFLEVNRFKPEDYDEEELNDILESAEKKEGTWKKPNIIVVFSESFWDITKVDNIRFSKDILENFHELSKEGQLIEMLSPSYGGVSGNVEFEIMTGGSLNYFSKGVVPYMQLFPNLKSEPPSIIKELRENGYKTNILNSSSKEIFNCSRVYNIYGVDSQRHLFDEIDLGGKYVEDKYLTDEIIRYFNNKPVGEKAFYFTLTMGGHMPYYEEKYSSYDFEIVDSIYNREINSIIKSYANGIYRADIELKRLYDYINTLEEDTILVFFGDHLPHLQLSSGKDILYEIGYLNKNYNLESVYRQFNTQALILSNYDIEYEYIKYLGPDLLFTYILNNMDIELSSFYRWLYTTKDVLPSSNQVVSVDISGNKYYTRELKGEMKYIHVLKEKVQYMLFK